MNRYTKKIVSACFVILTIGITDAQIPSFPGAEGYGAKTLGGRGGKVIEVTNLNDSGTGSFRAAVIASGPRIVVFRVAGAIELLTRLDITNPYLTIAGQTAPGDGITIKKDPELGKGPIRIMTHDVIIRFLRVRSGGSPNDGGTNDALLIDGAYNIVIDHSSFSWGTDEVFQMASAHDVSIQWNIIAEGLSNSTHPEGEHSKGLMFWQDTKKISVHHNLIVHNKGRNPDVDANGNIDLVNNVYYNGGNVPKGVWGEIKNKYGPPSVNIVNNYYKEGPNSTEGAYEVVYYFNSSWPVPSGGFQDPKVFVEGNIGYHRPSDNLAQNLVVREDSRFMLIPNRIPMPEVTTFSAINAYDKVLDSAGAIKPVRDAHDTRVVNDTKNGTGKIIDSPSQVGGWLTMETGEVPIDTEHDGMPDYWEQQHGLDISDPTDGNKDMNEDGYTNVEDYLNYLAGIDDTPTSINNPGPVTMLKIYPNPFTTEFIIIISTDIKIRNTTMEIFDLYGKEVANILINSHQTTVNRGILQSGIYLYRIVNDNRNIIANGKLVVGI